MTKVLSNSYKPFTQMHQKTNHKVYFQYGQKVFFLQIYAVAESCFVFKSFKQINS